MKVDMHAHWRPAALIDTMRQRTEVPRITLNAQGVEVIKTRNTEEPVSSAFDDVAIAAAEFERAMQLPGIIGVLMPANAFITRKAAEKVRHHGSRESSSRHGVYP